MTACAHADCGEEGTAHPVLLAMPKTRPDHEGPPAEMVLGILVCPTHQEGTTAADFVDDVGWNQIVGFFAGARRATPDRSTLGLVWKRPELVGRLIVAPSHDRRRPVG